MSHKDALNAAKRLAKCLKLTSRWGSVMVVLVDEKFVIVVDADPTWRSRVSIPDTFEGFEVAQQDRTIGLAYG